MSVLFQVDVKEFRPDDAMNTFKMSGPHRFAVTGEDIRLFALGHSTALVLRIDTVRQLTVPTNRSFRLVHGRIMTFGNSSHNSPCSGQFFSRPKRFWSYNYVSNCIFTLRKLFRTDRWIL